MKRHLITVALTGLLAVNIQAQQTGGVKLRGTRLTYPLVRKWIAEFNKTYPGISVEIAPKAPADSLDLEILAFQFDRAKLEGKKESLVLTRYVQLPIANSRRPDLAALQAKGFTEADFKKVYFSTEPGQVAVGSAPIVVYRRDKPACAAISFASHYGSDPNKAPGVGVLGDDKDLSKAVKNDPNGLSYNNLGFIYDVNTRKVNDSLAVVPLDLNENGKIDANEQIYTTLDEVISFVERTNDPKIPTEGVNVIFKTEVKNEAAGIFLQWVLNEGQKFNHEFGFINQQLTSLDNQKNILAAGFGYPKGSESSCKGLEKVQRKPAGKVNP